MSRIRGRKREEKDIPKIMPHCDATYSEKSDYLAIKWDVDHNYTVTEERRKRYEELKKKYGGT